MAFGHAHQFWVSVVRKWVGGGEAKGMGWRSRGSEEGGGKSFLEKTETSEWSIGNLDHATRTNGHYCGQGYNCRPMPSIWYTPCVPLCQSYSVNPLTIKTAI